MGTKHYHVITTCRQMAFPPFMTNDKQCAVDQYNETIEMLSSIISLMILNRGRNVTKLSDNSNVKWHECKLSCMDDLTYNPLEIERKRLEELAVMPHEDERGYFDGI